MTTYRTMCRHIFAVSKQVALSYKCVILGKAHRSTFCFHRIVQHMRVDRYKSTSNLVLTTLKRTGNVTPKTLRKPGILFGEKCKNPGVYTPGWRLKFSFYNTLDMICDWSVMVIWALCTIVTSSRSVTSWWDVMVTYDMSYVMLYFSARYLAAWLTHSYLNEAWYSPERLCSNSSEYLLFRSIPISYSSKHMKGNYCHAESPELVIPECSVMSVIYLEGWIYSCSLFIVLYFTQVWQIVKFKIK